MTSVPRGCVMDAFAANFYNWLIRTDQIDPLRVAAMHSADLSCDVISWALVTGTFNLIKYESF